EAVDEDVDDVGLRIEAVVKYMLEDHRLGDGAAGVAQEVFEQGKFAALQLDFFAGAHGFAGKEVEFDVAAGEASGFDALGGAADEGVEAREQFGKSKRFGEVIVTPRLEALDAVVHGGACAKDDDGRGNFFGAHALDEAKAIEPGQHEVDDGGIVGSGFGVGEGVFAVGATVHGVAGLLEAFDNEGSDLVVVLDHQDAHFRGKVQRRRGNVKGRGGAGEGGLGSKRLSRIR